MLRGYSKYPVTKDSYIRNKKSRIIRFAKIMSLARESSKRPSFERKQKGGLVKGHRPLNGPF